MFHLLEYRTTNLILRYKAMFILLTLSVQNLFKLQKLEQGVFDCEGLIQQLVALRAENGHLKESHKPNPSHLFNYKQNSPLQLPLIRLFASSYAEQVMFLMPLIVHLV